MRRQNRAASLLVNPRGQWPTVKVAAERRLGFRRLGIVEAQQGRATPGTPEPPPPAHLAAGPSAVTSYDDALADLGCGVGQLAQLALDGNIDVGLDICWHWR
ncbi:MAG: hypothetical protein HY000_37980 [Planctomycetes bacterium]|nr:hypothetical protein [Planctomycetia bacterium]MBI3468829.1 hypothetical protein [Planctomycetota bacterium]